MASDPYNLDRFVLAQDPVLAQVCAELAAGHQQSHWMWFIFPQLRGLGASSMAQRYAIGSLAEARAYLDHPLLGERLRSCTQLVNRIAGRSAQAIFGYPDYLKFRSCMTLFARAAEEHSHAPPASPAGAAGDTRDTRDTRDTGGNRAFSEALARYFAGEGDALTEKLLD